MNLSASIDLEVLFSATGITAIVGLGFFLAWDRLHQWLNELHWLDGYGPAATYEGLLRGPARLAAWQTRALQHGRLTGYLRLTLAALLLMGAFAWHVGMQEWDAVKEVGKPAISSLTRSLRDKDAAIRTQAIDTLGEMKDPEATPALMRSLGDENREVRWHAVQASPKVGIPLMYLPRGLAKRPQVIKNPLIAGFLNFMLPGLGNGYLGKWWGVLIFQVDITVTVWLFKFGGETISYQILFPLYFAFAIHAWYLAKKMPKDPP